MKRVISAIIGITLIFGCVYSQVKEPEPKGINKRIIYRDLTKPVVIRKKIPEDKNSLKIIEPSEFQPISKMEPVASQQIAEIEEVKNDAIKPKFFIEFENESILRFDTEGLDQFTSFTNQESHIFLVGHSHGKSRVGNLRLASKRAQIVAKRLWEMGYENIHVTASWGYSPVKFAPGRGVLVYVIDKNKDVENVPIVFARAVEKKQKNSPKDSLDMAAPDNQSSSDDV